MAIGLNFDKNVEIFLQFWLHPNAPKYRFDIHLLSRHLQKDRLVGRIQQRPY